MSRIGPGIVLVALMLPASGRALQPPPSPQPRADALAQVLALADARRFDGAALAALAAHTDGAVRAAAARVLGELADPRAADLLATLAGDHDRAVRAEAAAACGRLLADVGDNAVRGRLTTLLTQLGQDPDAQVRSAAAWAWGLSGVPEAREALLTALGQERDAAARAAEVAELWRARGEGTLAAAVHALTDPDAGVRLAAAVSLGRLGGNEAVHALEGAVADRDAGVRVAVLDALKRVGAAGVRASFTAALEDRDDAVRIAALGGLEASYLGRRAPAPDKALAATLTRLASLADPTRVHERVMAIRAAGAAGCCRDVLLAAAKGGGLWVGSEALAALARQRAPEASSVVNAWLNSGERARRVAAVQGAALLPDGGARVATLLGDADSEVRLAATEQAAELGDKVPLAALQARLGDADAAVRAAAVEALRARKAVPTADTLLGLLTKEKGAALPDAAVALVGALADAKDLPPTVRQALERLAAVSDPVVARAAWDALRVHGDHLPLPSVVTGHDEAFYRTVIEWAQKPRWLAIVTVRGTMLVRLDGADAPLTCYRLSELAAKGYFDDLTFHRVVPDFVVQGGDPRGDGWGGPGYVLRDELSLQPYLGGTVGMALSGPDTGGSQFFVTLTRQPHLDGRYPRIGEVVRGEDVARRIRRGDRILRVEAGEGALPTYYPIWYGPLDPRRLDAEIHGWKAERERYAPRPEWLARLATAKLRYDLVVAMGTWCGDSREQVPHLEKILAVLGDASPFAAPRLIGIDRSKEVDPQLFPYGTVELVPTIVVTAGGSEVGRIVETPKSGSLEEDLVRILAPIEGWNVPEATPAGADH